ncbi:DUF4365 domain-containing protein [Actinokineospora globicatena]|nr:DUF4365 domain-containing protein [Actinokineospora globicatena]
MSKANRNRVTADRARNRFTALMQEHGHLVHKIDGDNDFGEDLYVGFLEDDRTTGDTIAVQVKGGVSYRAAGGYSVRVSQHGETWLKTNVPVVCVVHDPESDTLHWGNASDQLRQAKLAGTDLRTIAIERDAVLDDTTVAAFVTTMRAHIRDRGEIRHALSVMSGHVLDTTDYLAYFMNEYSEDIIFRQPRASATALLLHSDWGWKPIEIDPEALTLGDRFAQLGFTSLRELAEHLNLPGVDELPTDVGDVREQLDKIPVVGGQFIVNQPELAWLRACAAASQWWRAAPA